MTSAVITAGIGSVLLDLIPVAAAVLLIISFVRKRAERRREEAALNEVIRSFSQDNSRAENGSGAAERNAEL